MTVLIDLNERQFQPGEFQTPDTIALDPSWQRMRLMMTRANWPDTLNITLTADISFDDGGTWNFLANITAEGGEIINERGVILLSGFSVPLAQVGNPDRKMRAKVNVSELFRSALTLEAF